ncbi:hypothetical protein NFI96_014134 [Prochilodus magdalenae]|nr:hypothetical protein NFI96_014134 [Prochilodus magdalenae]
MYDSSHHGCVMPTGVNSDTARVYGTASISTTHTGRDPHVNSGKKTLTHVRSGRGPRVHMPRNASRTARGVGCLCRGTSLQFGR